MSAYNVPITIRDPGPDGVLGNADDGAGIPGLQPERGGVGAAGPSTSRPTCPAAPSSTRWSSRPTSASPGAGRCRARSPSAGTRTRKPSTSATTSASLDTPSTPNDLINTDGRGRYNFSVWTAKVNGSYDARWGIRITPALRVQQGSRSAARSWPAPPTASTTARSASSPSRSTRSGRTTSSSSTSAPRSSSTLGTRAAFGVFFDVYNLTNSDAAQNINWGSGVDVSIPGDDHRADDHARSARSSTGSPFANCSRHDADSQRRGRRVSPRAQMSRAALMLLVGWCGQRTGRSAAAARRSHHRFCGRPTGRRRRGCAARRLRVCRRERPIHARRQEERRAGAAGRDAGRLDRQDRHSRAGRCALAHRLHERPRQRARALHAREHSRPPASLRLLRCGGEPGDGFRFWRAAISDSRE